MPGNPQEPRALIDMLMLGFFWLNEEKEAVYPRRAAMVFRTLRQLRLITENQRVSIGSGAHPLVSLAMTEDLEMQRIARKPPQQELQRFAAQSQHRMFVIVKTTRGMLDYGRLFGGDGYAMFLTSIGEEYARQIAPDYAGLLAKDAFLLEWPKVLASMGRQINSLKQRQQSGSIGAVRNTGRDSSIPKAPVSPEDWEW